MKTVLILMAMFPVFAMAQIDENTVVRTFDATYDPGNKYNENCDPLILGEDADQIKQFEEDGTIKVRVNIEENRSGNQELVLYVNEKAFRDYFNRNKITPYDEPRLVAQGPFSKAILPKLYIPSDKFQLWNRTGYVKRFGNLVDEESVYHASDYLQLSPSNPNPSPNEIINLKSSRFTAMQVGIFLQVTKFFSDDDPEVPRWMKGAEWTQSRYCVFQPENI